MLTLTHFLTLGALLALVVIAGLSMPRYSRIEVSTTIDANPATVFALMTTGH